MKVIDHLKLSFKEIQLQPVRTALTVVALTVSAIILVTLTSLSFGARQAITEAMNPGNLNTIVVTPNQQAGPVQFFGNVQFATPQVSKIDEQTLQAIAGIDGVKKVAPRAHIWEFKTFKVGDKEFVAQVEGISPSDSTIKLSAGTMAEAANEVVIGQAYAEAINLEPQQLVGQEIVIATQTGYRGIGAQIPLAGSSQQQIKDFDNNSTKITATISGVANSGTNQNSMFVGDTWAKQIRTANFFEGTQLKSIDQLARDGYSSVIVEVGETQIESIEKSLQNLGFGTASPLTAIKQWLSLSAALWVILGAIAVVALIAACLGIVNTMLVAVSEQKVSIGVWRAFGATKTHILMQFLTQAAIIGALSGIVGVLAGLAVTNFVKANIANLLQASNLQQITLAAPPTWLLVGCFALVITFSVLAGLYPALRAANQDPAKSLNAQ